MQGAVEAGDAAFAGRSWSAAASAYAAAAADGPLPARSLERWGLAAYLCGQDEASDAARERAHHAYLATGDVDAAVRVGYWLAVTLVLRGEVARSGGWFERLGHLVQVHGLGAGPLGSFLELSRGMFELFGGAQGAATERLERVLATLSSHDEPDLDVLVRNGLGQALLATGRVSEGLARLDEAMVLATTDPRVSPQAVGLVYCAVISGCRQVYDLGRAQEWTEALTRWCADQPDLVPYRGQCLVHRAELLALHGSWTDAQAEVDRVFRLLGEHPRDAAAGMAHYQRGELHRLRGEVARAQAAYERAARLGHDPQPGLALLLLQRGEVDSALAALRRAAASPGSRLRMLPGLVTAGLVAGELTTAESAAAELAAVAAERDVPMLRAAAMHAAGQVQLAVGDAQSASDALRQALGAWQALRAPYDAALTRVELARALRALGDAASADVELEAARWVLEQLGARPDLARVTALLGRARVPEVPGGLTPRECEVLRLVATGRTNRQLAHELFLSEKTVARHLANIFAKLGVSSRAAATSYAWEHGLV